MTDYFGNELSEQDTVLYLSPIQRKMMTGTVSHFTPLKVAVLEDNNEITYRYPYHVVVVDDLL